MKLLLCSSISMWCFQHTYCLVLYLIKPACERNRECNVYVFEDGPVCIPHGPCVWSFHGQKTIFFSCPSMFAVAICKLAVYTSKCWTQVICLQIHNETLQCPSFLVINAIHLRSYYTVTELLWKLCKLAWKAPINVTKQCYRAVLFWRGGGGEETV